MTTSPTRAGTVRAWRFRQCPSCRTVHAAGDLTAVRLGPNWADGRTSRRCPSCGHIAPTWQFRVVRERRAS